MEGAPEGSDAPAAPDDVPAAPPALPDAEQADAPVVELPVGDAGDAGGEGVAADAPLPPADAAAPEQSEEHAPSPEVAPGDTSASVPVDPPRRARVVVPQLDRLLGRVTRCPLHAVSPSRTHPPCLRSAPQSCSRRVCVLPRVRSVAPVPQLLSVPSLLPSYTLTPPLLLTLQPVGVTSARLERARARLRVEPSDGDSWAVLVAEALQRPLVEARLLFEEVLTAFPSATGVWVAYAEAELGAVPRDDTALRSLFGRSLLTCPVRLKRDDTDITLHMYYTHFDSAEPGSVGPVRAFCRPVPRPGHTRRRSRHTRSARVCGGPPGRGCQLWPAVD